VDKIGGFFGFAQSPRLISRGPIEADRAFAAGPWVELSPRLISRGPIEARGRALRDAGQ